MLARWMASLLAVSALTGAGSVSAVAPTEATHLSLSEGACEAHCVVVFDHGSQQQWFYVDGAGRLHLDYTTEASENVRKVRVDPVVMSATVPLLTDTSIGHDKNLTCGSDGWGWRGGQSISSISYPNGALVVTSYSHAGQAVRTTFNSNRTIQSSNNVASGVKPGTHESCGAMREEVMAKPIT